MILSKKITSKFLVATLVGASILTASGGAASAKEVVKTTPVLAASKDSSVSAYSNGTDWVRDILIDNFGVKSTEIDWQPGYVIVKGRLVSESSFDGSIIGNRLYTTVEKTRKALVGAGFTVTSVGDGKYTISK